MNILTKLILIHIFICSFAFSDGLTIFTEEEKTYLKNKKQISMCIDPNWLPFEMNKNGSHIGVIADFIEKIDTRINIPISLVETKNWNETIDFAKKRKCDIVSALMKTEDRKKFLFFTETFIETPMVLATRLEETFINDIKGLKQSVGVIKGYAYKALLEKKYPNLTFVDVRSVKEGLEKVFNRELYGFVETLYSTGFNIQKEYIGKVKISGKINETLKLSIGVRNDDETLLNILNKVISSFTEKDQQDILNKWISVKYENTNYDYVTIYWVFGVSSILLVVIFIILRINRKLSNYVKYKKKIENDLNKYMKLVDETVITSNTDLKGNITYASEAFCKVSGYSKEELIGKPHSIIKHEDMKSSIFIDMWKTINSDKTWIGEIKNKTKEGKPYWVKAKISPIFEDEGKKVGYSSIREDITLKKKYEETSITDELTQIYNRRHFNKMLPKIINSAKRYNELVCLTILDIDYFKQYNDTYGHSKGDKVLRDISRILSKSLNRTEDYCFRIGGEEFAILFKCRNKRDASLFIEIIRKNIEHLKIAHSESKVNEYITASFGVAIKDGNMIMDTESFFDEADKLLYASKEKGRNIISINE